MFEYFHWYPSFITACDVGTPGCSDLDKPLQSYLLCVTSKSLYIRPMQGSTIANTVSHPDLLVVLSGFFDFYPGFFVVYPGCCSLWFLWCLPWFHCCLPCFLCCLPCFLCCLPLFLYCLPCFLCCLPWFLCCLPWFLCCLPWFLLLFTLVPLLLTLVPLLFTLAPLLFTLVSFVVYPGFFVAFFRVSNFHAKQTNKTTITQARRKHFWIGGG